jgi:hypothetical protein
MKLGDIIIAQGTIRRTGDYIQYGRNKAYWVPVIWKEPREGMFIGWRYLSNGEISSPSYDEGAIYYPKHHFKVALVVFNERENPKYIPQDMILLSCCFERS